MPEKNIDIVKSWAIDNPTFAIFLWIDPESASSSSTVERNTKYYHELLGDFEDRIHFKDIENTKNHQGSIVKMADEYIRYEIDRLRPNYGASSDLLRYKILYEFGGAYFDSDVRPGNKTLERSLIFDAEQKEHRLYVDNNSQNTGMVGNDALICSSHNPLMHQIWETAIQRYHLEYKNFDPESDPYLYNLLPPIITYQYDDSTYILESTLSKTGPLCIRKNVETETGELKEVADDKTPMIRLMEDLTFVTKNDRGWVGKPLLKLTPDETIRKINSSVAFEVNKLKLLRLDDHVNNLIEVTKCDGALAAQTVIKLLEDISLTNLNSNLISIQLTYRHDLTIHFCETNNLVDKTYLFPLVKTCYETTQTNHYYESPVSVVMAIPLYKDLLNFVKENPSEKDKVMQELSKVNQATVKFLTYALGYCENSMKKIDKKDKHLVGQKSIIADYLQFLSENIKVSRQELEKFHEPLRNNPVAEEEQKESAQVTKFILELIERNNQLDEFLTNHKLKDLIGKQHKTLNNKKMPEGKHDADQNNKKDDDPDNKCHCRII